MKSFSPPSSDQVLFLLAGVAADPGVDLVGLLVPFLAGVASGVFVTEDEDEGCAEVRASLSSEFSSPSESDTSGVTLPICNWTQLVIPTPDMEK